MALNKRKNIIIFGGSGFIGSCLCKTLNEDFQISIVTRSTRKFSQDPPCAHIAQWDGLDISALAAIVPPESIVINLAGYSILCRWNKANRDRIQKSRIDFTRRLVEGLIQLSQPPSLYLQASAIGFYGPQAIDPTDETHPQGPGFLAEVCRLWEEASMPLLQSSTRRIIMRLGVVLGESGGFLARALGPGFPFFLMMPGSGSNRISWIHDQDLVNAIRYFIDQPLSEGFYNLVSPEPLTVKELYFYLTRFTRFHFIPKVPAPWIRLILGAMTDEVLFANQYIIPQRLLKDNFHFKFPAMTEAVDNLMPNFLVR